MSGPWEFGGGPPTGGQQGTTTLLEGSSFCVSGPNGDIEPGRLEGLYHRDTRILSTWRLRLDDLPTEGLAIHHHEPFSATFLSRSAPAPGHADSTVLVRRARHLGDGMREDVTVSNLGSQPLRCTLTLEVEADFADIFEVKENRPPTDAVEMSLEVGREALDLARTWGGHTRGVQVTGSPRPRYDLHGLVYELDLAPRETWTACLQVLPRLDGWTVPPRHPCGVEVAEGIPIGRLSEWRGRTAVVRAPDDGLLTTLRQSWEDLGVLRVLDPEDPDREVVAAGAPWFMTLFGRDALLTAWMTLPLSPSLALGTLQVLARHQGRRVDPGTEEQPGRILHEMRFGLRSVLSLGGGNVYYGTADATALFVMLVGELSRWGAPWAEVEPLIPHVDRALAWMDEYGDRDGDGFVEYERLTPEGLANQGWKDSWDGVTDAAGRCAEGPIALCEVQAYGYAAMVARAELAGRAGDEELARHWRHRARRLRSAFEEAYWLPDRGYYALALDGSKRPVDSLTSNLGHCLWTGIVAPERAAALAAHLASPELATGWGVRTLASSMGAYNPMSYHNGSVWPHDCAVVAAGLMRYGHVAEATRVARAVLDAAAATGGRLPELFCGFERENGMPPVPYPTACSPQAWSAAAPLLLLRTLLRLEPRVPEGRVHLAPAVPEELLPLTVTGLNVAGSSVTVEVDTDGARVHGLPDGLDLVREPAEA
ncbi:MAG TPA: glycogen debranching N-terminal domain-containing protein [Phycicoccus sp.]|nr:glycogen debranching N-terminal domain-containing protein [Phycicoccus sp.]